MKLSVVVPCYNEEQNIINFYNNLTSRLKKEKITYELVMVDDGSNDDTFEKLKEISKDKNVKVIKFSRNFGKEAGMLAGLEHCTGSYCAIMDCDMQHTPDMLVMMYEKLTQNKEYDVVCAYKESRMDEPKLKRFLTAFYYKINNKISNVKMLPGASDFRVFKKEVKDAIITLKEQNRFLKGMFSWIEFNTIYVPYTPKERLYGKSSWSIMKLIKYAVSGIISFTVKPLKFIFLLSVLFLIIGVLNFLLMGNLSSRTIILMLSLIFISVGIASIYIARIYNNVLNRPCYIIKDKINL